MANKIIRCATVGSSLNVFCKGLLTEMRQRGYDVIALSSPGKDLEEVSVREEVRTIPVSMERRISPIKDFLALLRLIFVFGKERPDMVHSMTPKAGLLCMLAAWLTRVPVRVHTFTGLVWPTATGMTRRILRCTDMITCACATHVIPEGHGVKDDMIAGGITRKPLPVLGYGNVKGVDLNFFSMNKSVRAKAESLRENGVFRFVYVGRIVRDKGIEELVAAFANLLKSDLPFTLKLALVGYYEEAIDPISSETKRVIEATPEIESIGPKFGEELLPYYAASDCFVFPSYREGFPNTVLEAGAMNLPSIVTDINGSREIVVDYRANPDEATGLIVPSKDEGALADAMEWMVTHAAERQRMAQNARLRIETRWEQSFVRGCLLDFYRKVLG